MEGLSKLWDYQKLELAMEAKEAELKNTPIRKQLVKLQKYLQKSQQKLIENENAARVRQDKLSDLDARLTNCGVELEELNKDLGYYSECDVDEVTQQEVVQLVKSFEKLSDEAAFISKRIAAIQHETEISVKESRELMQKMKKVRLEYDELLKKHKQELGGAGGGQGELKAMLQAAEKEIPAGLMKQYRSIKRIRPNPVAILSDSRCGGCNMQLPSGVTQTVANSDKPVLCENCGRILYIKED